MKCDNVCMKSTRSKTASAPFHFERGKVSVRRLNEERKDGSEWLRETPQKRIEAVEFLRAGFPGAKDYASQRISRFLVITRQA